MLYCEFASDPKAGRVVYVELIAVENPLILRNWVASLGIPMIDPSAVRTDPLHLFDPGRLPISDIVLLM